MKYALSHLSEFNRDIINEEYVYFRSEIKKYPDKYYVYSLMDPFTLEFFYYGKGKGMRVYGHFSNNNLINCTSRKNKRILQILSRGEFPMILLDETNLLNEESLSLEKDRISEYGRIHLDNNGSLTNISPGGVYQENISSSSIGGKIGGKITKEQSLGIFSPDYDRSYNSKNNWVTGKFNHLSKSHFSEIGKLGGIIARDNKLGIFGLTNEEKSNNAKYAASCVKNRGGIFSSEWIRDNQELVFTIRSEGGKTGGKVVGSLPWWNNGFVAKRASESPGEGWVRGMLKIKWWNNGTSQIRSKIKPGVDWVYGQLKIKKGKNNG